MKARPDLRRDAGAAAMEFMATMPFVMLVICMCFEAIVAFMVVERVENAARAGARVASMRGSTDAGRAAAGEAMPGWVNDESVQAGWSRGGGIQVTVRAQVPLLWKGIPVDFGVTRRVEMPVG
ncbi:MULTISPECIES: TadE/TadG family type IV pilus assembly protein [Thermomonosporaceae]|uniref:TadE/TadG family type IV pilus assembly protein n=1 Tax=Thermomonosporaceae TaxID=2012 RepID=UPI00255AE253|nr:MULTISPECIES: TadE/TadG family type IV pilus assembly protein [Thermomonosporaceae]MDL4772215.1 TadE/TadG family type IV pilus assembly protein [Actinomadura xylanilytica]